MPQFTKRAICSSCVKLLNQKKISQITVKDIVDDCGINRNTFYYYYQNIPQLIETIVSENLQDIIDKNPTIGSFESLLKTIVGFAFENKKAFLNIYNSANRNIFEQYLWRICEKTASIYLNSLLKNRRISDADRISIIEYLTCTSFGFAIRWFEKGLDDDYILSIKKLSRLKHQELEAIIVQFATKGILDKMN